MRHVRGQNGTETPRGLGALLFKRIVRYVLDGRRGGAPVRWERIRNYVVGMTRYARSLADPDVSDLVVEQPFCVILASFRRCENMPWIVAACLKLPFVREIILLNNNPAVSCDALVSCRDSRLVRRQMTRVEGSTNRLWEAARRDAMFYLAVDDDLFLQPRQWALLARALLREPTRPHGIVGDNCENETDFILRRCVPRQQSESVDILLRAYAYTRQHLEESLRLHEIVARQGWDLSFCDDLLISRSGTGKPAVHDVGPWVNCLSSGDSEVSLFRCARSFNETRCKVWQSLCRIKPFE